MWTSYQELPPVEESISYIKQLQKASVAELLSTATTQKRVLVQPRCGTGRQDDMMRLLQDLEAGAHPDILSLTIDSYTRIKAFGKALHVLHTNPSQLNGYPLVAHGWKKGRELNDTIRTPLQIRHGSPDARRLFTTAIAAGITSFEGGGISYNLPYSKTVPLSTSLEAWREVDRGCGELAEAGIHVDRELFGTLTAVLMPPSICLAITMLEAICAAAEGVKCISIAYPQGGCVMQDVAALRSIRRLAAKYLPEDVSVYPVLHEFMGAFPLDKGKANALITSGGLVARLGGAAKVITKTSEEAYGIPSATANIEGMLTTRLLMDPMFDFITLDEGVLEEEMRWIEREVAELIDDLVQENDLQAAIVRAFQDGRLDIPFSASRYASSAVIPLRDAEGAIRFLDHGGLSFSTATITHNRNAIRARGGFPSPFDTVIQDIFYFCGRPL